MPVVSVGEKFPDLQFETYAGKTLRVSEVVAQKKHTLFWVMRFIGCRFCQYDLDELAKVYGSFEARDAQVFAVLQSSRNSITGLKGQMQVPFEVVCDTAHAFYKALDVRAAASKEARTPTEPEDLRRFQDKQAAVAACNYQRQTGEGEAQQLPALFIVDSDGVIEYAHYGVHSIDIPSLGEMLRLLDTWAKGSNCVTV